jgi:hypothetical protein
MQPTARELPAPRLMPDVRPTRADSSKQDASSHVEEPMKRHFGSPLSMPANGRKRLNANRADGFSLLARF